MAIDDKAKDEKLQYNINREAAKIYLLGKAFEKQTEKQVSALKSLDLSNKKDELKQFEGIFSQNLMNNLI